jgi:HAD superfamily hydrolase (TIGR01549 family)
MLRLADRKFWIFDMDGTLTVPAHDFDAIRTELGLPQGRPILEQIAEFPPARARELLDRLAKIEREIAGAAVAHPGARELLDLLTRRGARLGILTRNSHAIALETLARCDLASFFLPEFILGREACDPKPSPDGINKLLERWNASPSEAVMVGDYRFDIESGREAKTATIYVGAATKGEWTALADLRVEDLRELRSLLEAGEQAGPGTGA